MHFIWCFVIWSQRHKGVYLIATLASTPPSHTRLESSGKPIRGVNHWRCSVSRMSCNYTSLYSNIPDAYRCMRVYKRLTCTKKRRCWYTFFPPLLLSNGLRCVSVPVTCNIFSAILLLVRSHRSVGSCAFSLQSILEHFICTQKMLHTKRHTVSISTDDT